MNPIEPIAKQATYQDVIDAPPHMVDEILEGQLSLRPRPAMLHARAASKLAGKLDGPFDAGEGGPGGWWIIFEPEIHLAGNVLVPDIAGWRRERMPEYPDTAFTELAPDWACEILSPSTRRIDRHQKRSIYAHNRVQWLWHIDPEERELEAFELQGRDWLLIATLKDDDPVSIRPFDAIGFRLGSLWPPSAQSQE